MSGENLHEKLLAAYTEANLNKITTRVIEAYRKKNFAYIRALYDKVDAAYRSEDQKINKIFAGLMLSFHPDRLKHLRKAIEDTSEADTLSGYSHIFAVLENLDMKIREESRPEPEVEIVPEEEYGLDESDFDYFIDEEENFERDIYDESAYPAAHDFITTLSLNEYGHNRFEIPQRDLENMTGMLDMSNQGIDDLTGIDACVNLTALDLSDNELGDITELGYLNGLEELYLSGNMIMSVESMMLLHNLRKVDLSFNSIDDISPLIGLPNLEYINVIGNKIPTEQLGQLRSQGVVAIAD